MKSKIIFSLALFLSICSVTTANSDLLKEASLLYNNANFAEAISVYQKIIESNPKEIAAYANLAYLYKDLADYEQAVKVIKEALRFTKDLELSVLLGQIYYLAGKPDQAILHFKALLPYCSEDPEFLLYLGACYEDIGKLKQAEAFYLESIKFKPDYVLAYLKLGNIYYQKQKLKEAVGTYQKIISLDPSITMVRPRIAECYSKLGEFTEAYKQYAKCVAIYPEDKLLKKELEKIKEKLGEDFFKEKERLTLERRREKSIKVKASGFAKEAIVVRVGIAHIRGSIEFKCGSDFAIIDKQTANSIYEGREETIYTLLFEKKKSIQLNDYQGNIILADLDKPLLIKNKSEDSVVSIFDIHFGVGNFWAGWGDQQYRGVIEVMPDKNGFWLINLINLEEYLYSVLPSEMPASWPKQALCAQAIAARTWAVKNLNRHKQQGFNFCITVHCQVYNGVGRETSRTSQAVDETAGLILVSDDQPIVIFYSNSCGGSTREGIVDIFSSDFHFPFSPSGLEEWLKTKPDAFCNLSEERSSNFRWSRLYKQEELEVILNQANINIGRLLKIIPQERARSGHLNNIKIEGTNNKVIIEGESKIRKILGGLLSSAFKIEAKYHHQNFPEEFIFYGAGFGHGRGLCQTGIKGMALKGYDYLEILKHYYPDAQIKKIY